MQLTGDDSIASITSSFRSIATAFRCFPAGQSILLGNANYLNWWFSLSCFGRKEVGPSSLVTWRDTDEIYLVGQRGSCREGDRHREELFPGERLSNWLSLAGGRDGRSGFNGSHRKPCSKEPGGCSRAEAFSFGRLAVSYLSQI